MARTGAVAMPETPDAGDDPVGLWNSSRDNVLEALDQPNVIGKVGEYWFGEATIDDILAFAQWDPLGHAWDLAQAVGLESREPGRCPSLAADDRADGAHPSRDGAHRRAD